MWLLGRLIFGGRGGVGSGEFFLPGSFSFRSLGILGLEVGRN